MKYNPEFATLDDFKFGYYPVVYTDRQMHARMMQSSPEGLYQHAAYTPACLLNRQFITIYNTPQVAQLYLEELLQATRWDFICGVKPVSLAETLFYLAEGPVNVPRLKGEYLAWMLHKINVQVTSHVFRIKGLKQIRQITLADKSEKVSQLTKSFAIIMFKKNEAPQRLAAIQRRISKTLAGI